MALASNEYGESKFESIEWLFAKLANAFASNNMNCESVKFLQLIAIPQTDQQRRRTIPASETSLFATVRAIWWSKTLSKSPSDPMTIVSPSINSTLLTCFSVKVSKRKYNRNTFISRVKWDYISFGKLCIILWLNMITHNLAFTQAKKLNYSNRNRRKSSGGTNVQQ